MTPVATFVCNKIPATNVCNGPGQNCLELGCGAGVVGVALSRACAAVVQLTDGNAAAVGNCKHNLAINFCTSTPEFALAGDQDPPAAHSSKQVLPFVRSVAYNTRAVTLLHVKNACLQAACM